MVVPELCLKMCQKVADFGAFLEQTHLLCVLDTSATDPKKGHGLAGGGGGLSRKEPWPT